MYFRVRSFPHFKKLHFQCAISDGKIDASYIMCGHKDVVKESAIPGIRGLYDWVKNHAHYGRQATAGGVSNSVTAEKYLEEN